MARDPQPSRTLLPLALLAGLAVAVCLSLVVHRPDRPVATIVPGSSSGPAFVVQIIRPRLGLPLGGILPPQLFGLEAHLGFDSTSAGASIGSVGTGSVGTGSVGIGSASIGSGGISSGDIGSVSEQRLQLSADGWDLALVLDDDGRVTPESQVVFELVFEERLRKVRCRPADPAVGTFSATALAESGGLSGSFDVELARCEDADTGKPLGWPPKPLVLHGSFDRLPLDAGANRH